MDGIELLVEQKRQKRDERRPAAGLLCLLAGVYGIVFLLGSINGISYIQWLVHLLTAIFCGILWLVYNWKRKWFLPLFTGMLLAGLLTAWKFRDILQVQGREIMDSLYGRSGQGTREVTALVCLICLFLSLLLFWIEITLRNHMLLYIGTSVLLLIAPLFGIHAGIASLVLLVFFQIAFWALRLLDKGKYRLYFPENRRRQLSWKICRYVTILMGIGLLVSLVLVSHYEESFYNLAYEAEGRIYRVTSELSGRAKTPVANGLVSSGNNYATGTTQLQVTASRQPTEPLYLRGFTGGDYVGGNWLPADDEQVYAAMNDILHWQQWASMIGGMYENMYYVMNSITYGEAQPIILAVWHENQDYTNLYMPYYSRRSRGWDNGMATGENTDYHLGYFYRYFEQKDMNVQWSVTSQTYGMQAGWYKNLEDAYRTEANGVYTRVPTGILPQLTELVEENPLEDLNEISEFILYTLNTSAIYTRTPGWAPVNEDIVEYFLFEGGQGYCVHFASAATLLYRMYGIPARYVSGYVLDPADFTRQEDGTYLAAVTDESAHAWTEILLDDYGWTPVEVTPTADGSSAAVYPGFEGLDMDLVSEIRDWRLELPQSGHVEQTSGGSVQSVSSGIRFPDFQLEEIWKLGEVLGISLIYLLFLVPVFLDYRRQRWIQRMEYMSTRKLFARFMQMLHFGGYLQEYNGSERNFAGKLAEVVDGVTMEEAIRLQERVMEAAYGAGNTKERGDRELAKAYRKTADWVYHTLSWRRKLLFRYGKAFG